MNPKSKTAIILGVIFSLVMLIGLPLYIFSVLNKYSRRSGQSDAIAYLLNGKPVLATVIKEFKANSDGSGGGAAIVSGVLNLMPALLIWKPKNNCGTSPPRSPQSTAY